MYSVEPGYRKYPRLFFSSADIPALKRKIKHPDCQAVWRRFLKACEERILPEPTALSKRHIRAEHLAFAYVMTGRRALADGSIALLKEILAKPYWSSADPAKNPLYRADLSTGGNLNVVIKVYDWLNPLLSREDKKQIRDAIVKNAFEPALNDIHDKKNHTEWYTCNGINVLHGPLLMAAILLEKEVDTRDIYEASLRQIQNAIAAHCCDGGYPEGPGYWNYGIRHMLYGVEVLRRLKGIDLYHEPFLHNTGDYGLHYILPWISNCHNPADATCLTHLWEPMAALAAYHKRPEWQWLARRLITHKWANDGESIEYTMMYLIYYEPTLPAHPPAQEKAVQLFSGLQNLSMRSDWSEKAIAALWLSGASNFHHNHLHLNSFSIAAFRKRLLIDLGGFDYSNWKDPRKMAECHNTLLADGEGQIITTDNDIFCRRIRPGQWGTVYGELQCLRNEAKAVIATGKTTNAYAGRLRHFDRTLAFVDRRFFFMHDFIELEKDPPMALEWRFHSAGTIELTDTGAKLINGDARLAIVLLDPGAVFRTIRIGLHELALPDKPVPSLDLKTVCTVPTYELCALFVPYKKGQRPAFDLSREGDRVEFNFNGQRWSYDPALRKLFL